MNTKPSIKYPSTEHHLKDLKEAIYYLPPNIDHELVCTALKVVYREECKDLALEWFHKSKNIPPSNFEDFWGRLEPTTYQLQRFDSWLKENLYDLAKQAGWIPKALRKGKNTKRPAAQKALKAVADELKAPARLEENLASIKERDLPDGHKSFIPPSIVNLAGGCYYHPFMKNEDIPENQPDYLAKLSKIVDCEVHVLEAIEYVTEQQGRRPHDKEVRYKLELTNRKGKRAVTEATHEELTTPARFSSFLVSKGFIKFIGTGSQFDLFHQFLINGQQYPTIRNMNSWGEFEPGEFLFENGMYSVRQNRFIQADDQLRIDSGSRLLICPSGSEQVTPPVFSEPRSDSQAFLTEKFMLWDNFNGAVNVRTTLGYAVACLFSRQLKEELDAFPLLFKFGERGTGKSTSMDWFMALFGYRNGNRQSVSKQNTVKSVLRRMTLPCSFPYFLDDYRNHETNSQAPDLTSSILNWYHRIGSSMAKKSTDHQTIVTPMKACVVMTGNDKPTDPAVLSRLIILNYNKFLKDGELQQVKRISDHTHRFSEFSGLIFQNYQVVRKRLFDQLEANQRYLAGQGFQGRTVNNWAVILAGFQSIECILPGLSGWFNDFEALRGEICGHIKKEQSLQNEYNPIHDFFHALEHFATQKFDPASDPANTHYLLDHRHFRIKETEQVRDHTGQVLYSGPVLAIHLWRIWSSLQDARAAITTDKALPVLESHLQNSSYFLAKSEQTLLTKSLGARKESNVRCTWLNVDELAKKGMLEELIDKAREHQRTRVERLGM